MEVKRHWIGQHWYLPGAAGNDINKVSLLSRLVIGGSWLIRLKLMLDKRARQADGVPIRHINGGTATHLQQQKRHGCPKDCDVKYARHDLRCGSGTRNGIGIVL